jgi:phytoene dehydrogenase-like protein
MKVDMAFSGRLDLHRHHRWRGDGLNLKEPGLLIGTPETTARVFARACSGEVGSAEEMAMWTAIPTAVDPSQAPDGMDTLYLYAPTVPLDPELGWNEREKEAADAMVTRAAHFFDGVDSLELGRWVESPLTMAQRTNATNGCVMHVDWDISRTGPLRPAPGLGGYQTPVPGLYLGGAGAHPGGAVTGLPGRLAAREVIRELKGRG